MDIPQATQIALELTQLWASKGAVTNMEGGIPLTVANTPEEYAKAYATIFEGIKNLRGDTVR